MLWYKLWLLRHNSDYANSTYLWILNVNYAPGPQAHVSEVLVDPKTCFTSKYRASDDALSFSE